MNYPCMVPIRQHFDRNAVDDVEAAVRGQLERVLPADLSGQRIAITAGSRGIRDVARVIASVVTVLRRRGASAFIVPAMGSHGGATAEGQRGVLESLGVTEARCGAPIRSCMEVVRLGTTAGRLPVYMDRYASEADGVILVNRIKAHTDFRSDVESGLLKMAAIGLGKQAQALLLHSHGIHGIRDLMKEAARVVLASGKILCGVAILENAYDETAHVEAILPGDIPAREPELLAWSKQMMPRLPVEDIDLLIVDEMGKNYSGTGMDTNVVGRMRILGEPEPETPRIKYIFVRDLSAATHGNATGVGLADLTTRRLFDQIDFQVTTENVATSTFLMRAAIPLVHETDRAALDTALRATWGVAPERARVVHIPNTLELEQLRVSESLLPEAHGRARIEAAGRSEPLQFNAAGNLSWRWSSSQALADP